MGPSPGGGRAHIPSPAGSLSTDIECHLEEMLTQPNIKLGSMENYGKRIGVLFSEGGLVPLNGRGWFSDRGRERKQRQICNKKVSQDVRLIEINQWVAVG